MKIDFDQLKELLAIVSQNDISEITVESGEERITVKKPANFPAPGTGTDPAPYVVAQQVMPAPAPAYSGSNQTDAQGATPLVPSAAYNTSPAPGTSAVPGASTAQTLPLSTSAESQNNFVKITSPMVGTFYRSPSPNKPPFVEVGDAISVGQTVCIIEAMKLMNDLPSEVSGRIVEVLAETGATVEYGQPLFLVDPET